MRKLEFLIADAKERGHDSVITLGGIQSNHCRATAVAARYGSISAIGTRILPVHSWVS